jgi:hypothetical protein
MPFWARFLRLQGAAGRNARTCRESHVLYERGEGVLCLHVFVRHVVVDGGDFADAGWKPSG